MRNDLAGRAEAIALQLTSWPSVTGTADEAAFAPRLAASLAFFETWTLAIPGDALGRANVFALKRGQSARTIVLAGHFDTVPFDDYGNLKHLALDPHALREGLIARLQASGEHPLALADLASGDFLPGRGLLDMKAGLAAGIAAMEAYGGDLTLLLLATPDEEDRSAGMRAAAPELSALAAARGLEIALVINLDAISDQGDGSLGRSVAMGSIGKQLLSALVTGKEAHACYPGDGVNAAYLMAELVTEFELAPELAEASGDEMAAPPTALNAKDLKQGYNVTTPAQAFAYWNTLQHRRTAEEVLDIAATLARRAMDRAAIRTGSTIPVIPYGSLKASSLATDPALDFPERTRRLMADAFTRSGHSIPAVVLGFASIPYPAVTLDDANLEARIMAAARPHGMRAIRYFPGISDMSFLGRAPGDPAAAANTPLAGSGFTMPSPSGYPVINIGPWGRDYHHWLERLHAGFAFDVLPRLLLDVIAELED